MTGHVTPQPLGDKSVLVFFGGGGGCQSALIVAVINLVSFKSLGKMENWKENIILYSERCYLGELHKATSTVKYSKWFEPRSISSSYSMIVRVSVVLRRTVVGD